jgi:hypothetical protein
VNSPAGTICAEMILVCGNANFASASHEELACAKAASEKATNKHAVVIRVKKRIFMESPCKN